LASENQSGSKLRTIPLQLALESTREQIRLKIHGMLAAPKNAESSVVELNWTKAPEKAASSKNRMFETSPVATQSHSTQELKETIMNESIKNSIQLLVNTFISRSHLHSNTILSPKRISNRGRSSVRTVVDQLILLTPRFAKSWVVHPRMALRQPQKWPIQGQDSARRSTLMFMGIQLIQLKMEGL